MPMVKADAYGLGAIRVACALEALDPWGFGVATVADLFANIPATLRLNRPLNVPSAMSELAPMP